MKTIELARFLTITPLLCRSSHQLQRTIPSPTHVVDGGLQWRRVAPPPARGDGTAAARAAPGSVSLCAGPLATPAGGGAIFGFTISRDVGAPPNSPSGAPPFHTPAGGARGSPRARPPATSALRVALA